MASALITFAVSSVALPLVRRRLIAQSVLDRPTARSLHVSPVPRGAGIALAIGLIAGLASAHEAAVAGWVSVIGLAALGAWDDVKPRSALLRLLAQFAIAALVVKSLPEAAAQTTVLMGAAALFFVSTVNAVNFMDGVNGMTALHAILWGTAYTYQLHYFHQAAWMPLSLGIIGAGLAFVPWNFPVARMFLGDSGSYLFGGAVALMALAAMQTNLLAALAPLATYVADTGFTALRRLFRGANPFAPHTEHVYEQLVKAGWSHTAVTALTLAFSASSTAIGLFSLRGQASGRVVLTAGLIALNFIYLGIPALLKLGRRSMCAP